MCIGSEREKGMWRYEGNENKESIGMEREMRRMNETSVEIDWQKKIARHANSERERECWK